uniref:Protein phosphatase n=1 Tax=Hemiselmis andersenii TaxID=464988 RepID=A0A6T8H4W7_HEMAN
MANPTASAAPRLAILLLSLSLCSAFSPSLSPLSLRRSVSPALSPSRIEGKRVTRSVGGGCTSVRMGFLDALKELAMPTEIADTADRAPEVAAASGPLAFAAGVSEIADPRHPMEDAWFVAESEIGMFDGVSGAMKSDNQDGIYSFMLSSMTQRMIMNQKVKRGVVDTANALEFACSALADSLSCGASTACVAHFDTTVPGYTTLQGVNVGDSGLSVVRRSADDGTLKVVWKTNPQQHFFNCPFQLGGSSPDSPDQAMKFKVPLQAGDLLVVATDGFYDNVYENQMIDLLEYTRDQDATSIAQALVGFARQQQEDPSILVPYGVEAQQAGERWSGGKLDDTCVMVLRMYNPNDAQAADSEPQAAAA